MAKCNQFTSLLVKGLTSCLGKFVNSWVVAVSTVMTVTVLAARKKCCVFSRANRQCQLNVQGERCFCDVPRPCI